MDRSDYISLVKAARLCNLSESFLKELSDFGFFKTYFFDDEDCIECNEMEKIVRIYRLHSDLNINYEGVDIILAMRKRIVDLESELQQLTLKLNHLEQEQQMRLFEIPKRKGLIDDID